MISNLTVVEKLGQNDHNIVKFETKTNFLKKIQSFMKTDFRNTNFVMLRSEIRKMDKNLEVDVESKWKSLKNKCLLVRNYCMKQKNISLNKPKQPK